MRLNAAFLVGCIFLLSACAPLQPEPGMNFKDFNSKSALNMRGYLIPAGMYKDVGVSRYETRQQKLQRKRGEAQPANGWVFYYEKDGVMISEQQMLELQAQKNRDLQASQKPSSQIANTNDQASNNISTTNQRSESSSAAKVLKNGRNSDVVAAADKVIDFLCHPKLLRVDSKSGSNVLRRDISETAAIRVKSQRGVLTSYVPRFPDIVSSLNGAMFKSSEKKYISGTERTVITYDRQYIFKGDPSMIQVSFTFSPDWPNTLMLESSTSESAPNILFQAYECTFKK